MSDSSQNAASNDATLRSEIDRSLRHPVMFFFTSGALWLFVAVLLGFAANYKLHDPLFWGPVPAGRLSLAHQNALVYGWGFQASFGAIIWLMARLSRRDSKNGLLIILAGHIWNGAVSLGVLCLLFGGLYGLPGAGNGMAWLAFPSFLWPVLLLSYLLIVLWSGVQFQLRDGKNVYISQWYLLAALFAFPWLYGTANLFIFVLDGHPVMKAAISEWYRGSLVFLFFAPVAIACAYYLAPKVTGRPVYSYHLAKFGFWALMIIGPWAGLQKLAGAPIPRHLPYLGAASMVLFLIPALAVAVNILRTVTQDESDATKYSPSLRFILGGMVGMLLLGVLNLFLFTPSLLAATQFSLTGYGLNILALYGFFSMCAFGLIYFVVPRITRREWLSRRFIKWHFYLSLYGVAAIVLFSIFGGLYQGMAQNDAAKPWVVASDFGVPYAVGTTMAWAFMAVSNLVFLFHLLLMWARLGRRSSHPTLLDGGHHGASPHGPEGDIDELSAANA